MGNGSSNIYPVHVLGRSYQDTDQEELLKHTESFFRFTYRRDIPAFCSSSLTSDAGWGCMLRAAQMVMGNTLLRHYLGPDWRIPPDVQASRVRRSRQQTLAENAVYCELVRWFSDHPGAPHLYSLHHLVHLGLARYDKPAGQWVGPSTAAYMLRDLAKLHCALYGGSMEVLVTQGDTIYAAEATAVCTRTAESRADFVRCLRQAWEDPATATDAAAVSADGDKREGVADEDEAALEDGEDPEVPIHPLLLPRSASEGQLQEAEDAVMVRSCLSVLSDGSYIECSTSADAPAETDGEPADALPKKTSRHESQRRADSSGSASAPTHKKDEFFDPLLRPPPKQRPVWTAALMVLVPLRLGIHSLNPEYYEEVKEVLRHRHCMGILGGRPNHAIYFVGHRGDFLLGLDPHTVFPNTPAASAEQHTATEGTAGPRPPPHVPFNGAAAGGGDKGRRKSGADASIKSSDKHTADSCRSQSADSGSSSGMTGLGTSAGKHGHKRQLGLSSPYNLPATAPSPDCAPAESMFSGGLGSFGAAFTGSGAPSAAPPSVFPSAEYLAQVHVSEFVTLEISRLDPSLTLAFYFPTQAEFDAFFEETVISTAAKLRAGRTPLYTVQQTVPAFMYAPVDDEEDAAAWNRRSSGRRKAAAEGSARRRGSSCSSVGDSKEMRTSSFDPSDVDEAVSSGAATGADGTRRSRGRSARGVGAIPGLQQQSADSGDEDWLLI